MQIWKKREVTLELAEQVLKDIISPNANKVITADYIITTVAEHFDITPEDIKGTKRSQRFTFPRQIVMYLCREMTGLTLAGIAKVLGKNDHTTVLNGVRKIEKEIENSKEVQNTISVLKKKLNPPS
jgi:chromosomal replication initiator protein